MNHYGSSSLEHVRAAIAFIFVFTLENRFVANDCFLEWFISKPDNAVFFVLILAFF